MTYPSMVALFGATQGLLLTLVVVFHSGAGPTGGRHTANVMLGAFILAESLRLFLLAFTYGGLYLPRLEPYALLNVTIALGPLLYFYVRAFTEPQFKVANSLLWWHLAPAAVLMLANLQWLHSLDGAQWQTGATMRLSSALFFWASVLPIIGFMGMRQPQIFQSGEAQTTATKPADETPSSTDKYKKSGLNRQESAILWDKLELLMQEQQPFLHNGLKLTELAEMLDVVPNHLSQIVNTHAEQSFFDYINSYRVQRAKQLLRDPSHGNQPIAQLALESGFNSQNTFYNQFRKKTGTTPSKYRQGVC